MNRLSKGALATGVGVALLLGGTGTLALWNDSVSAHGNNIESGVMTINQSGDAWEGDAPALWVPGDKHVFTTDIEIAASGDNMKAVLDVNTDSVSGDPALLDALDYDLQLSDITDNGVAISPEGNGTYTVTPANAAGGSATAKVTLTVSLPESVTGTVAQNESANLSDLNLSLNQVR